MEQRPFGFSKPNFLKKRSSLETNAEISTNSYTSTNRPCQLFAPASLTTKKFPFTTSRKLINSYDDKTKSPITSSSPLVHLASFQSTGEVEESVINRPHVPTFFQRPAFTTFVSTPSRKPINSPDDETPIKSTVSLSPLVYPASYESTGEVEESVINRPHVSIFFQRPFNPFASELPFIPRRKQIVAEIKHAIHYSVSSPGCDDGIVSPFRPPSRFNANHFFQNPERTQQLPNETQDKQFEGENVAGDGAKESDFFHQSQWNETIDNEKQHLDEGERNEDTNWMNMSPSQPDKENISFGMQVGLFSGKLIATAGNTEKSDLNSSQIHIQNLETEFFELKKKQSEAMKRVNDLSFENETLYLKTFKSLQEHVSALAEQLEIKEGQCKEVNSQLEGKELQLKKAIQNNLTLKELLRSTDERLCSLQTQLQVVLTEYQVANVNVKSLTGTVDDLQEDHYSLELTMSSIENNFHSFLGDYMHQQDKLEKELASCKNTECALKNGYADLESVKEELKICNNHLIKVQTDSNAIEKEKLELEEHFARLNEKHVICEQSHCAALENVTSLKTTQSTLQAEIQQLKHQLETCSTQLATDTRESESRFREALYSELDSLKKKLNDSEEKYLLNSVKMQQELDCERAGHTQSKMAAEKELSDAKKAQEFQVNTLQENLIVMERKTESIKQELEIERKGHRETKSN